MLQRSFKPVKCKTALKLAVSRIKLLNNKREVQLKQFRRELAQLLESGQVQTARIRVEHVIREEKTLTAYNLVEIYCELIAARLPIIESQKNCPNDLKEAITSVIYATPRCSDVQELAEVKKHLKAKYGKEFITSAVELRPDCGVNRMLVEKLSSKPPDGQTKLKILTAIAEEHNVKWDPASFSESDPKPPQDLLKGPSTFEMASKIHSEDPAVPARSNQDDKGGTPDIQVPPKPEDKSDVFVNSNTQNTRPTYVSPNYSSSGVNPNNAATRASFQPDERFSGSGTGWTEQKQSFPRNENDSSLGRQDWTMHFKDATSAAQAAAESAERASIAARAAAELSRQHSSESPRSYGYSPKNVAPQTYTGSKLQSDHFSEAGENNAFHQRNSGTGDIVDKEREERKQPSESQNYYGHAPKDEAPQVHGGSKFHNDQVSKEAENMGFHPRNYGASDEHIVESRRAEQAGYAERLVADGHNYNDRYSNKASFKSSTVSTQDASSSNSFQRVDYPHGRSSNSFESDFVDELGKKNHLGESQAAVDIHDSKEPEEIIYFDDRVTRKQSSTVSHRSHSSSFSDDHEKVLRMGDNITYSEETKPEKQPNRASSRSYSSSADIHEDIFKRYAESKDPFVHDDRSMNRHHSEIISNENTAVFDDYVSDGDDYNVDKLDYSKQEPSASYSSPVRKSSTNLLGDSADWSPRRSIDERQGKSSSQSRPSLFSESSEVSSLPSQLDELPPAAFDNYDSPSSDSEEDLGESKLSESTAFQKVPSGKSVQSRHSERVQSEDGFSEEENLDSWRSPWSRPAVVDSKPKQAQADRRSQGIKYTPLPEKKFEDDKLSTVQPISRRMRSRLESTLKDTQEFHDTTRDSEPLNTSSFGRVKELNFGTLTGGLRNKGNRHPPYTRETSDTRSDTSLSPSVMPSVDPITATGSAKLNEEKGSRAFAKQEDSDDNHSKEEAQQETSITKQLYNQKSATQARKKTSLKASLSYFDSDDTDSDKDVSKSSPVTTHPGPGLSRRTKASFKPGRTFAEPTVLSEEALSPNYRAETRLSSSSSHVSETIAVSVGRPYLKTTLSPEEYVTPNYEVESRSLSSSSNVGENVPKTTGVAYSKINAQRESVTPSYRAESKPFSSSSHVGETSSKHSLESKSSDRRGTLERRRLVEQNSPKQVPESRRFSHMDSLKSSTSEPKSNYLPRSVESVKSETPSYRAQSTSSISSPRFSEAAPKSLSETTNSGKVGIREHRGLVSKDSPEPTPASIRSSRIDSLKSLTSDQEPKLKSPPKSGKPEFAEAPNSPTVTRETSSKDKASHVHPNLPDSDSFTAFFKSLKQK